MTILERFESILSKSKSLSKSIDDIVWLDFELEFDNDFDVTIPFFIRQSVLFTITNTQILDELDVQGSTLIKTFC
jgi:hypothetical protein